MDHEHQQQQQQHPNPQSHSQPSPHQQPHYTNNQHEHFQWMDIESYPNSGTHAPSPIVGDYNEPYNYSTSVMPIEPAPIYAMARPPPYSPHQHLQPLHPLIVPPPPQWPSMIASQASYSAPALPTTTNTTPVSAGSTSSHSHAQLVSQGLPTPQIRHTTTGGSTPRRTLSNDDRRQMCQYAEENPGIKQNDIGGTLSLRLWLL